MIAVSDCPALMIRCIINHQYCVISPVRLSPIQVLYKFDQEEQKGLTVILTFVDGEEQITKITDTSYDTDLGEPLICDVQGLLTISRPSHPTTVSPTYQTFIYVNDSLAI